MWKYAVTEQVLDEVAEERERQDKKWGEQNHMMPVWLMILSEEFGEAARAANECYFGKYGTREAQEKRAAWAANYREELVQVAAVAVAMIESFDRNEASE